MCLIGSDRFLALAESVAISSGAAWIPKAVVPHPIGGIPAEDILRKAETIHDHVAGLLAACSGGESRAR